MCDTASKKQDFVHLHQHSTFSLGDALPLPDEIIHRTKELGFPAAAITDHGRMGGHFDFVESCRSSEGGEPIKPILGCEMYVMNDRKQRGRVTNEDGSTRLPPRYHLTVLAKNAKGYENLLKLSRIANTEGFYYKPCIDEEVLFEHHEGLVIGSGCMGSQTSRAILSGDIDGAAKIMARYKERFGDDYFLEMHNHGMPEQITLLRAQRQLSQQLDLLPVAANDNHYLKAADKDLHSMLVKHARGGKSGGGGDVDEAYGSGQFWMKTADEMANGPFRAMPEAVANSLSIAEKIEDFFKIDIPHLLPAADVPINDASFLTWKSRVLPYHKPNEAYLAYQVFEGLKVLGLHQKPEYVARAQRELKCIWAMGVNDYFLIQREFVKYMQSNNILFGVRGSGVGSIVNYCLGISNVDPLRWDLMFERFLNPGRGTQYRVTFADYPQKAYVKEFGAPNQTEHAARIRTLWAEYKALHPDVECLEPEVAKEFWVMENQNLASYLCYVADRGITTLHNECQLWAAFLLGICPSRPDGPMIVQKSATLPDIDTDIDNRYRDQVVGWMKHQYGEENVAPIGAYNTFKARAAVKTVLKMNEGFHARYKDGALGMLEVIAKTIPEKMLDEDERPDEEEDEVYDQITDALEQSDDFRGFYSQWTQEVEMARRLMGRKATASVHPSGYLVSSEPIYLHVPMERAKKKAKKDDDDGDEETTVTEEEIVTAFDMQEVERCGLVKYDLLGLKMIQKIARTIESVKARTGIDIDLKTIDMANPNIFKLYQQGKTNTLFQFASRGMKDALVTVNADCIEDLIAVAALYRPGPLKFIAEYGANKKRPDQVKFSSPELKQVLGRTYGIPVYQEQAMQISSKIAGFNNEEVDKMRKSVSKKDPVLFEKVKHLFEEKATDHGVAPSIIEEILGRLSKFAGYAFNRSHACSYAILSYHTAYLRWKYPADWFAACLQVDRKKKERDKKTRTVDIYIEEASKDGIKILKPHINISGMEPRVTDDHTVVLPLVFIPGVGAMAECIVKERELNGKFNTFRDLVFRGTRPPNKAVIRALAEGGAFSGFKDLKSQHCEEIIEQFNELAAERKKQEQADKRAQLAEEKARYTVDSAIVVKRDPKAAAERVKRPADSDDRLSSKRVRRAFGDASVELKDLF